MSFCLILLAAGKSNRFNSNLAKPYHKIGGKTLIEISLKKASYFKEIKKVIVVHRKKDLKFIKRIKLHNIKFLTGGPTRQSSTYKALKFLKNDKSITKVLIHDAARPNFSSTLLKTIIRNMKNYKVVVPTLNIQDAIKQKFESGQYEYIVGRDREDLFLTQTPQAFNFNEIYKLHKDNNFRYPHIGLVIIDDNCEIGSGSIIDRGSLSNTIIGKNTYLDNQIHIAHNNKIGNNCIIAGQVGFAGSSTLGNNVMIGGQAGISGHLKIGNNIQIGGGSGVIKDIPDNSKVMGYPAKNLKSFLKDNK